MPLLFAYGKNRFSHDVAHFILFFSLAVGNIDTGRTNRMSCQEQQEVTTIMILSFRTDRSGKTVQTQIGLPLEKQSDQGLHCLHVHLLLLGALFFMKVILFKF